MIDRVYFDRVRKTILKSLIASLILLAAILLIRWLAWEDMPEGLVVGIAALYVIINILYTSIIYILKASESAIFKKIILRLFYILSILIATLIAFLMFIYSYPVIIDVIVIVVFFLFLINLSIVLFVYNEKRMVLINSILLGVFILSFVAKRFHLPFSGLFLIIACVLIAASMFFYSARFWLTLRNNRYLQIISTLAAFLLALNYIGYMWKLQHWAGAGLLLSVSFLPSVILTAIVLLTLPQSGFINWTISHKQILTKKLLYLWFFVLIFGSLRFILPTPAIEAIFSEEVRHYEPFNMTDYKLDNKNGLSVE